ncbi:MAG: PilZ domain-containing protein [Deltaproteobacteria bacterium]|nr:PilZ domain-containing protein [Deltaproteobacteria bacterium]MBW1793415.1 PilZ domain-containing protein [Deltaproteobacteria bacterium]MBW2330822.1 PilZ domain-containing protein [Deltaproteobacteria bacterium]
MNEERRKKTRVYFKTQVTLKTDKSEIVAEANSKDISIKGMFVSTGKRIPVGTPCDVEILLTGTSTRLALSIKGVITRQDASGLGLAFDSMDIDSYFHLKNIVMYNASDPEDIEKEML